MNSVNITGRLTADPELRSLASGESVCKLRLAVEGMSPGSETGYVNVSAFGKPGDAAARALAKGWLVARGTSVVPRVGGRRRLKTTLRLLPTAGCAP